MPPSRSGRIGTGGKCERRAFWSLGRSASGPTVMHPQPLAHRPERVRRCAKRLKKAGFRKGERTDAHRHSDGDDQHQQEQLPQRELPSRPRCRFLRAGRVFRRRVARVLFRQNRHRLSPRARTRSKPVANNPRRRPKAERSRSARTMIALPTSAGRRPLKRVIEAMTATQVSKMTPTAWIRISMATPHCAFAWPAGYIRSYPVSASPPILSVLVQRVAVDAEALAAFRVFLHAASTPATSRFAIRTMIFAGHDGC